MPAVVDIPVLRRQPVQGRRGRRSSTCIEQERPELIILGKSMVLHPEPVYEVRQFLDAAGIAAVLMYDMAHVLGLVGPHFQQPFAEGADIVTGSTHKTFFGTQRGIIGGALAGADEKYDLWEAIERRDLPGLRQQPPPGHAARPAHGGLRDEPLQGRLPAGRDRQRQGLRRGAARRRARRRRRPGRRLHRDAPGRRAGRLRPGTRRSPAGSRTATSSQLPGGAGRGGLHGRRRPAPGRRRDDALRHGARSSSPRSRS